MLNECLSQESSWFLPQDLLASACRVGNDLAWRKRDLLHVAAAAENYGVASAGWKVLFLTPDGDLELSWNSFYPDGKREDESLEQFVGRTWVESRQSLRKLFEDDDLIDEGRKVFRLLRETETPDMLPSEALWFVLYFAESPY